MKSLSQSLPHPARVYRVGGAVRDALLGLPIQDRDFVVVGATPDMMRRAGFLPVGKNFPVFLHPKTHEEYALARTEKKCGQGYHGFTFYTSPDVTLEEDLARRDVTINAMAMDEAGNVIDPFSGARDLEAGILRHVSPAFAEDPLRVLRVARFAARFDFRVADDTMTLMRTIASSGELATLPAERLWAETAKALTTKTPARFLQVLRDCGALAAVMPEVDALYDEDDAVIGNRGQHTNVVLNAAARCADEERKNGDVASDAADDVAGDAATRFPLPVRFALLCGGLDAAKASRLSTRLKVPQSCADAARLVAEWQGAMASLPDATPETLLSFMRGIDALRRPQRLTWLVAASRVLRHAHDNNVAPLPPDDIGAFLMRVFAALQALDEGDIARHTKNPAEIPATIRNAQRAAIAAVSG